MKKRAIFLTLIFASPLWGQTANHALRARATSTVETIHVKAGDSVKKGALLVQLDAALQKAQLDEARAEVAAGEANAQLAEAEYRRAARLVDQNVISKSELEVLVVKRQQALANLDARKARLAQAAVNLSLTQIHAPEDGKIQQVWVKVGDTVKANVTIVITFGEGKPQKEPDQVRQLLKERHAVLIKAVNVAEAQFKAGRGTPKALFQAHRAASAAELELCETRAQRIDVLRKDVERATEHHKRVVAQFQAGAATPAEPLETEAMVLEARIRLAREEAQNKAGK